MALHEVKSIDISGIDIGSHAIGFDNDNLYFWGDVGDLIYKISRDGELIDTYDTTADALVMDGICFDGKDFWTVSKGDVELIHYSSTFDVIKIIDLSGSVTEPQYIATDGKVFAVFDADSLDLFFIDKEGNVIKRLDTSPMVNKARGIAFDGHDLWIGTQDADTLIHLDYGGNIIQTLSLSSFTDLPRGHCFDGNYDRKKRCFTGKNLWLLDSRGEDILCLTRN